VIDWRNSKHKKVKHEKQLYVHTSEMNMIYQINSIYYGLCHTFIIFVGKSFPDFKNALSPAHDFLFVCSNSGFNTVLYVRLSLPFS
jgi:hypothetical protein